MEFEDLVLLIIVSLMAFIIVAFLVVGVLGLK